jgi:hypothetical protein
VRCRPCAHIVQPDLTRMRGHEVSGGRGLSLSSLGCAYNALMSADPLAGYALYLIVRAGMQW